MDTYKGQKICADDTYITYHARGQPRQLEVANWMLYVKISPYASYYRLEHLVLLTNSIIYNNKRKKGFCENGGESKTIKRKSKKKKSIAERLSFTHKGPELFMKLFVNDVIKSTQLQTK